jgi:hypothetical protein
MLLINPDVIIAGDFNTQEQGIQELAESIGIAGNRKKENKVTLRIDLFFR